MSNFEYDFTKNRELSWLKFNQRVLEEAEDINVPLLEKLKFVSIFTSNLDEFFMIRVGSLFHLSDIDDKAIDNKSGMSPKKQLEKIYKEIAPIYLKKDKAFNQVEKALRDYDISCLQIKELEASEKKYIQSIFETKIMPVLSPQIVNTHHPFPHLLNKTIHIVARLKSADSILLGIIPISPTLPDIILLPGNDLRYVLTENIIFEYAENIFEMYKIVEKNILCVTRNADISPDDEAFDINEDFRFHMKKLLNKRKRLSVVRMEISNNLSSDFEKYLCEKFEIEKKQIFKTSSPMKMNYVFYLFDKLSKAKQRFLTYPAFMSQFPKDVLPFNSIIKQVKSKDLLFSYPYESMDPFLSLIKEASSDPNVISIKITIYRLANKSKLVEYLCMAAENEKDVTVLIELRARFDEQNNIDWSEALEKSGCRVIYGFDEFKVHSKACLITYKEKNGVGYITQIGTGNYNEKTSELYTDLSLVTNNKEIGLDVASFFKNMSIGNLEGSYNKILVSPVNLKKEIMRLIDEEIKKGSKGKVLMKLNSITDIDFIKKLSEASNAGVNITLIIRGICCILPNIKGKTENIKIISIVGRFLEHSRIYVFGDGDEKKMYISSADMMTRNTERRVEVACPVVSKEQKERINKILETMLLDNVKARILNEQGDYVLINDNKAPYNCQEIFMEEAILNAKSKNYSKYKKENIFMRFIKKVKIIYDVLRNEK